MKARLRRSGGVELFKRRPSGVSAGLMEDDYSVLAQETGAS